MLRVIGLEKRTVKDLQKQKDSVMVRTMQSQSKQP